ncbi:leucine-rich repeat isoform f [Anaeramoeba flamelloides]|uniref:Leucine-rich repeat isoform f n=1 Tax=Anaeramoeba flamelloides TaxID=1746091 RepID=A0AAV8A657_9EUKA|nr:leucine-rich repeat isoform f [Anaeramoeba flamelloides]
MSKSGSCRTLTQEETCFLNDLMNSIGEKIQEMTWIRKRKTKNKKLLRIEDRILVISKYRIFTVGKRKGSLKKKICRSAHLFEITKIIRHEINHIELIFKNFQIDILSEKCDDLVTKILQNYRPIIEGFPDESLLKFEGESEKFEKLLKKPTKSIGKGFVETYKAWCNCFQMKVNQILLDLISENILQNEDKSQQKILNLSFMSELPKEMREGKAIKPLVATLMHNRHFEEIYISGVNWKQATSAFSTAIGCTKTIKKVTFSDLKICDGFKSFGPALTNPLSPLEYLDLSNNLISGKEMKHFAKGLENMKTGLKYLNLSNNSLNSDSITKLLSGLKNNSRHLKIEHLDLSNNKFQRSGSLQFGLFLRALKVKMKLSHLNLSNCSLDLGFICETIVEACRNKNLQHLNLSNNKCKKKDVLSIAKMCQKMATLKHLSINNCDLKAEQIAIILEKIFKNENLSEFAFRASSNIIDLEGIKKIQSLFKKYKNKNNLQELFLDDCQMGNKGLSRICKSIQYLKGLERLSLSMNFSQGKTDKYLSSISSLFEIENLKFLRLAGNKKSHMTFSKTVLNDFFQPLMTNSTLKGLDISGNKLGDSGCAVLANCLSLNKGLNSLALDGNDITLKTIQKLIWSSKENQMLFDIKWPQMDIDQALKKVKKRDKESYLEQIPDLKKKMFKSLESNYRQGGIGLDEAFGTILSKSPKTKKKTKAKARPYSMKVSRKVTLNSNSSKDAETGLKISKSEPSDTSSDSETKISEN